MTRCIISPSASRDLSAIVDRVEGDTVEILRVVSGRQDLEALFAEKE
jgi:plasmid stabilization system protein ParE